MKCKGAQERWHRRLDRRADDEELDRHLRECAKCRAYAARMGRVIELLDGLREDTESLVPSTSERSLRPTSGGPRAWVTPRGWTLLRIAAAVVVAVGAGLWHRAERGRTVSSGPSGMAARFTAGITLQDKSRERFIAVAGPSDDPRVQTFWVYPRAAAAGARDRL